MANYLGDYHKHMLNHWKSGQYGPSGYGPSSFDYDASI